MLAHLKINSLLNLYWPTSNTMTFTWAGRQKWYSPWQPLDKFFLHQLHFFKINTGSENLYCVNYFFCFWLLILLCSECALSVKVSYVYMCTAILWFDTLCSFWFHDSRDIPRIRESEVYDYLNDNFLLESTLSIVCGLYLRSTYVEENISVVHILEKHQ